MAQETFIVDPNEDLDTLINRLKQSRSKDVLVVLPNKTRALETLDNFNALRRMVREENINVTFTGGSKTVQGLAKLLGFQIDKGDGTTATATDPTVPSALADFATTPTATPANNSPFGGGSLFGNGNDAPAFNGGVFGGGGGTPSAGANMGNSPFGMPEGFFVAGPNNGGGAAEPPIPNRPQSAQELFNQMTQLSDFAPPIPPRRDVPPPPLSDPFGGAGDTPITRDNASSLFGDFGGGGASPFGGGNTSSFGGGGGASLNAGFDTGGSTTMDFETAQRQGLLDVGVEPSFGGNTSSFGGAPVTPATGSFFNLDDDDDDDDIQAVLPGDDNAADNFRKRGGVRRGATAVLDEEEALTNTGRRRRGKEKQPNPKRERAVATVGAGVAGTGVFSRFKKILNPVDTAPDGGVKMTSTLTIEQREARRKQSSSLMFGGLLALLLLILTVGVVLFLFINPGGNQSNQPGVVGGNNPRVTIGLTTANITDTVTLLLEPATGGGAATPASPNPTGGATNVPGAAGTATPSSTDGKLAVTSISTGEITKKLDQPYPAFGSKKVADGTAKGTATFVNGSAGAVGFAAGSEIWRNPETGVSYRTVSGVTVPGAVLGASFGRASVQVQASEPGPKGNTTARSFNRGGSLQISMSAMEGGSEKTVKVVSPDDQKAVQTQLLKQAEDDAFKQIQARYDAKTQGVIFGTGTEPKCSFSKQINEEADNFLGSCTVVMNVYVYNMSEMNSEVNALLLKNAPNQNIAPDTTKFANGQVKVEQGNRLSYTVNAMATRYSPMTEAGLNEVKKILAGKTREQAVPAIQAAFPGIVIVQSDFTGTFPDDPAKIDLVQKYDFDVTPGASPSPGGSRATPAAPAGTTAPTLPTPTPSGR